MCPECGLSRFATVNMGSCKVLKPRSWFIYLGLPDALEDFFDDDWWTAQRGKHRDVNEEGSYWGSEEYNRMKQWLQNEVREDYDDAQRFSPYDLLLDWLEPYDSCQHSTGVVSTR